MDLTHGQCSLFLCPEPVAFNVNPIFTFINALQEIGLIAQKINPQKFDNHYFAGDKYLDFIAYMGCAPAIQFEAKDKNPDFCFIKIYQYQAAELIVSKKQSRAPHCPACDKPVENWQTTKTGPTIRCDQCNITSNIEQFDWRKMAGYARLFIEITDVFPKEAVPQQLLLNKLAGITETKWQYFYSCQ